MRGYERHPCDTLEMLRFTSCTYRGEKLFDKMIRRKFTKADVIKRLMKEQKDNFGPLLETKKEKIRRIKREKKGIITEERVKSNVDSEFSWILKISGSRLKHYKFNNNQDELFEYAGLMQKNVVGKSTETHQKISPDKFSSSPNLMNEKKSSTIETIEDSGLCQVQIRMIYKTSRLKAASKSLPEFVIDKDDESETKNEFSQKRIIREIRRSQTAIEIPKKAGEKSLKQFQEGAKAEPAKTSLKSLKMLDNSCNPIKIDCQAKAPSLLKLQLENIDETLLFNENEKDCAEMFHSSKILSISATEDEESLQFPSVTRILYATMSDEAKKMLARWTEKMTALLGQEGFDEYKSDLMANGKLLHSSIDSALRNTPFEVPHNLKPCFNSVQSVLKEVTHVKAIESHVVHRELGYRGVLDCVASYRGNLCLIDWKKSDKTKKLLSSTYDAPLQIASYIGALNADKNYPFQIKSGLLVIAYTAGKPPTVYELDETKLQHYWKQWLARLKKYFTMQNT